MTKSINSAIAAILFASVVAGGASSAFADSGDYYSGVGAAPIFHGSASSSTSGTAATVNAGGDGDYYAGVDRNPVDATTTGSIVKGGAAPAPVVDNGDYFQGLKR